MSRKIHVSCVFPPIPITDFDYEATYEGFDLGDPVGYGATEQEAIDSLLERESDEPLS
jgi:hypothetical protein